MKEIGLPIVKHYKYLGTDLNDNETLADIAGIIQKTLTKRKNWLIKGLKKCNF